MLLTLKGLIVRENIASESARYIHAITAERGLISVLVRGSSSRRGRFAAPTQLFCYSELVLYEKGGKYSLNEATLIENYFTLCRDYDTLTLGSYVLSAAEYVSSEEQPDPGILKLALNTLWVLAKKPELDRRLVKGAFELRLASIAGFTPDLTACRDCGGETTSDGTVFLSVMDGCLVCRDCMDKRQLRTHTERTLRADESNAALLHVDEYRVDELRTAQIIVPLALPVLLAMQYSIWCEPGKLYSFTLAAEHVPAFAEVAEKYLENHLEHHFAVLDMLTLG